MVFDPFSDLGAYAKHKNRNYSTFDDTEVSSQNFLDLGSLVVGSKCQIRLTIVNDTPYEISVSSSVEGRLSNEAVNFTTLPNSFCPGLSHSVFISFIVSETAKNMSCTVANIMTNCVSPTHPSLHLVNCCPVFYRAVKASTATSNSRAVQFPICIEPLLDELLDKFDLTNTLMEEKNTLKYNPSSNSFTFPQQQDFSHSNNFNQKSFPTQIASPPTSGVSVINDDDTDAVIGTNTSISTSIDIAKVPRPISVITRQQSNSTAASGGQGIDSRSTSPVVVTRRPSVANMRQQVNSHNDTGLAANGSR
jgi:hypothetical protein